MASSSLSTKEPPKMLMMFDIDGTLVKSYEFDSQCFQAAVKDVLGIAIDDDWGSYRHVTDTGILNEVLEREAIPRHQQKTITQSIKQRFFSRIANHLERYTCEPLPGAVHFLETLKQKANVVIALATGGWYESALMKLQAAGLSVQGVSLATASDHFQRINIMALAEQRSGVSAGIKVYFGDGPWDRQAAEALGYRFVLVGNRFEYTPAISHFDQALAVLETFTPARVD